MSAPASSSHVLEEQLRTLGDVQRAAMNILEDFGREKEQFEAVQRATLNILEDFDAEKGRMAEVQSALLNILDDIDVEKAKVAGANQQLGAANKELEAFTYSVAHDLRAPLRHIDGFTRLLAETVGKDLGQEAQHYMERILSGTQTMTQLVEDLLNLSRVGRREMQVQMVGLNTLVTEVLEGLEHETQERQVEWKINKLPFVEADASLLKQVLANLLSNALKYTRPRERAAIEVGTMEHSGDQAVFVRDNGVGFSMKYADKLFGIFQRLHRAEDFEGTGVGLATVQRIIHKHGGRVWAEAELDKGATFFFTIGRPSA